MMADEYLIKTVDGSDYKFDGKPIVDCLSPEEMEVKVVQPEYGDVGIVINGIELSFCFEPPGLQVAIEVGEPTEQEIESILGAIIKKLEKSTGQQGEFVPL